MDSKIKVIIDGSEVDFDAMVNLMDDGIREDLHSEGIEDAQEFADRYVAEHESRFGERFEV